MSCPCLIVDQLLFCGGCNVVSVLGILGNSFSLLVLYPRKYEQTKAKEMYKGERKADINKIKLYIIQHLRTLPSML